MEDVGRVCTGRRAAEHLGRESRSSGENIAEARCRQQREHSHIAEDSNVCRNWSEERERCALSVAKE